MEKWEKRDRKRRKKRYGMRIKGRSIFTIVRKIEKNADETKKNK
jgi:hypothetical protein